MVDITGLDRADVLVALYNHSKLQGLGFLQARYADLTKEEAEELLRNQTYFDYLYGKVMKVDLSSETEFGERLYDRDLGVGTAQSVINKLRESLA